MAISASVVLALRRKHLVASYENYIYRVRTKYFSASVDQIQRKLKAVRELWREHMSVGGHVLAYTYSRSIVS